MSNATSRKIKVLFDIAPLVQKNPAGVGRVTVEILKRFRKQDDLEILLFCSEKEEQDAWRHLTAVLGEKLPFHRKDVENIGYIAEEPPPPKKSFLRTCEDNVRYFFPKNKFIGTVIETVRRIKWFIKAPPPLPVEIERPRSPFLEQLCREADVYFSPLHIPVKEIDVHQGIKTLLIVYDAIPYLFPDLYSVEWAPKFELIKPNWTLFSTSECTKTDLRQHFPNLREQQIAIIPLGADECFRVNDMQISSTEGGIVADRPYILSIATMEIRKNFAHIIRCFGLFAEKYRNDDAVKDCVLVLTGQKGWKDDSIYQQYKRLPSWVKQKIIFTGYVNDADLPKLYSEAACFCYMSLYEGFGLPPLEAMQSGTPVIASNTSSLPEVVGDAGILLDPKDEPALVEAFYRVLTDENLRRDMIQKGLEQAKQFSWERCVEIILEKIRYN